MADPTLDQLDTVQHPVLGQLKFPKDMPFDERNDSINWAMQKHAANRAIAARATPSMPAVNIPVNFEGNAVSRNLDAATAQFPTPSEALRSFTPTYMSQESVPVDEARNRDILEAEGRGAVGRTWMGAPKILNPSDPAIVRMHTREALAKGTDPSLLKQALNALDQGVQFVSGISPAQHIKNIAEGGEGEVGALSADLLKFEVMRRGAGAAEARRTPVETPPAQAPRASEAPPAEAPVQPVAEGAPAEKVQPPAAPGPQKVDNRKWMTLDPATGKVVESKGPADVGSPPVAGQTGLHPVTGQPYTFVEGEGVRPSSTPSDTKVLSVPDKIDGTTLQASAFGLDYLAKDLKTLYQEKLPPLKEFFKAFQADFTPRTLATPETLDSVMKMTGQRERNRFTLDQVMHTSERSLDKMPREAQVDFIDRIKTGQTQATPELQELAEFMRKTDNDTYIRMADSQVRNLGKSSQKLWDAMSNDQKLAFARNADKLLEKDNKGEYLQPPSVTNIAEGIMNFKDNHFRVMWKVLPGKEEEGAFIPGATRGQPGRNRPLAGDEGFKRQATLSDISEGLDRGGEPFSYNPVTLFKMSQASMERSITAHNMWNDAKDMGNLVFQRGFGRPPEGWVTVADRMGQVRYVNSEGKIGGGQWIAQEDFGRLLNNMLGDDFLRQKLWVRNIISTKNYLTAYRLGFSGFHYFTEGLSAVASQLGTGMEKVNRAFRGGGMDAFKAGIKDIASAPYSPRSTYKLGANIVKYVSNKDDFIKSVRGQDFLRQFPEVDRMLDDMFSSGAKLALHEDEALGATAKLRQAWAEPSNYSIPVVKGLNVAWKGFWAGAEKVYAPLFQYYIPRLKAGMFFKEYSEALVDHEADLAQGNMSRGELGRQVWNSVEDRFGQVNWDKFFWTRNWKTTHQVLFRAAQWAAGNVRFTSNAVVGQFREFAQTAQYLYGHVTGDMPDRVAPSTRAVPRLDPNFSKLFGLTLTYVTLNSLTQLAAGQGPPKDLKDAFAARIGGTDNFGKPKRVTWPAIVIKDTMSLMGQGANKYVANKFSDLITGVWDVIQNRDFRGNMIFDPNAEGVGGLAKNVMRGVGHVAGAPISIQSAMQAEDKKSALTGMIGLRPPPTGYGWTPFEKYVFNTSRHAMEAQTPDEAAKTLNFYHLQSGLSSGSIKPSEIDKLYDDGKLSKNDYNRLFKHFASPLSPLQRHFETLHVDQMLRAYRTASPAERAQVEDLMADKMRKLDAYTPPQQEALIKEYESLTRKAAPGSEEEGDWH